MTDSQTNAAIAPAPPVCTIGASAGGVRALQDFFSAIDDDLGLSYVVGIHLSPTIQASSAQFSPGAQGCPSSRWIIPSMQRCDARFDFGIIRPLPTVCCKRSTVGSIARGDRRFHRRCAFSELLRNYLKFAVRKGYFRHTLCIRNYAPIYQ
jgi:CheB methylesterase